MKDLRPSDFRLEDEFLDDMDFLLNLRGNLRQWRSQDWCDKGGIVKMELGILYPDPGEVRLNFGHSVAFHGTQMMLRTH